MKTSPNTEVKTLYDQTAESYDRMMDAEINLPIYADTLSRLARRIKDISGDVVDTSCGSGHMLELYHTRYDQRRALMGIDLSPEMVRIAEKRLGSTAKINRGDMRDLRFIASESAAAVISFFALHHLDAEEAKIALIEWNRILRQKGQLVIAIWEGFGKIDYGDESDVIALRYTKDELESWVDDAGFVVNRCTVESVEDIPMDAIYLEATKGT